MHPFQGHQQRYQLYNHMALEEDLCQLEFQGFLCHLDLLYCLYRLQDHPYPSLVVLLWQHKWPQ